MSLREDPRFSSFFSYLNGEVRRLFPGKTQEEETLLRRAYAYGVDSLQPQELPLLLEIVSRRLSS